MNIKKQNKNKNKQKKIFSFLHRRNNYLSHKSMVQRHFLQKYSFQGIPNQVGKLRKFGGGGDQKQKPPRGGGGGGMEICVTTQ